MFQSKIHSYYKEHEKQALADYFTFLRFKSISSEPEYKEEVNHCADFLIDYLKKLNFTVEKWETSNHPVIYAENLEAGPDKPTLLIYNHYDVQPVDPIELWKNPPFEPTLIGKEVYARGAQDNKGQCFYTLFAIKSLIATGGKLPVNVKFCIEGEEECGSLSLAEILPKKKKALKADYLAIVDMGIKNPIAPSVTLGVRGIVTMDVEAIGTYSDLHSGSHGGMAYNPLHALIEILSSLRDKNGKIKVPGFYNQIVELTEEEKKSIELKLDEEEYVKMFGKMPTGGEKNYSPQERAWLRPTIEVNGLSGGYSGLGFKTVIPAKAIAKVSCRLVPNQSPDKIGKKVKKFLEKKAPPGIDIKVTLHEGGGSAVRTTPFSKITQCFAKAYEEVFDKTCKFTYSGGSIPIIEKLQNACQGELVLMGLGLPDDEIHAPNEHFGIDRIEKGVLIIARTLELLGK